MHTIRWSGKSQGKKIGQRAEEGEKIVQMKEEKVGKSLVSLGIAER